MKSAKSGRYQMQYLSYSSHKVVWQREQETKTRLKEIENIYQRNLKTAKEPKVVL